MNKTIGFSTGSVWRLLTGSNRNELIDYIKIPGVQAAELALGSREELYSLSVSAENIKWLRGLRHVSIHAPALHKSARSPGELKTQLEIIGKLAEKTGACAVVIHSDDIPSPDILKGLQFPLSLENIGPGNYTPPDMLSAIFNSYPDLKFCLDLSHAALTSEKETETLISRFGNRISHIHISGVKENRDHQSLISASALFYRSIIPALSLDVPFLIEEDISVDGPVSLYREFKAAEELLNRFPGQLPGEPPQGL